MATLKGPSEGGSGGKRGHRNMEHWGFNDEVRKLLALVDGLTIVNLLLALLKTPQRGAHSQATRPEFLSTKQ